MANQVQFNIQRIYLKDLSFESPMTPDVFTNMSSSPKVGFNFESNINNITDDIYELTLFFNVKAEVEDKTLYLVELKQCGVFSISTDDEAMRKRFLNVHCAEIVYPYARENISNVIRSIFSHDSKPNICVINSASSDEGIELIRSYRVDIVDAPQGYPNALSRGYQYACNQGWGDIPFCSDEPDCMEREMWHLQSKESRFLEQHLKNLEVL